MADAVVAFEMHLVTALHTGELPADMGAVAGGKALSDVVSAVQTWKQKGWSLRGEMTVSVLSAKVTGGTATAGGCLKDGTAAYAGGSPVETPHTTWRTYTATLTTKGTSWVVTSLTSESRPTCSV